MHALYLDLINLCKLDVWEGETNASLHRCFQLFCWQFIRLIGHHKHSDYPKLEGLFALFGICKY